MAFLVSTLLLLIAAPQNAGAVAQSPAEWTILVFMNGDNNLEPDALINFAQLAAVGSTAAVKVVVQFDRIGKYAITKPQWTQTLRFLVKKGTKPQPSEAVADIGEANMGDPQVLADFVKWGRDTYPAKHYMLIIWDHGQGWRLFTANFLARQRQMVKSRALPVGVGTQALRAGSVALRTGTGIASSGGQTAPFRSAPGSSYRSASNDETDNDVLYNSEIEDGLKRALGRKRLDIIAFDACLMSMLETAYAFRDVADFLVGSEELEPGLGLDYRDWLSRLGSAGTLDARGLAEQTVASYEATYTAAATLDPSTTMSAIELSRIPAAAAGLSRFTDELVQKLPAQLQTVAEARGEMLEYAPGYTFHHVDLIRFLDLFATKTRDSGLAAEATSVADELRATVVRAYSGANRKAAWGSNGIAIYFPATFAAYTGDPYNEGGYEKDNQLYPVDFVRNEKWADFLHAYWGMVP